jgi:hypothetical protein
MQGRRLRIVLLSLTIISLMFAFSACEPLITIRVQNQTDMVLQIYQGFTGDEIRIGSATPNGEVNFKIETIYQDYRISAKDENGNMVFSTRFRSSDLSGKKEYLVIITKDKLILP